MAWRRLRQLLYERLVRPILFVQDTPRSKAGGVALGVFVALTPTVGIQMPISFAAATILGVNQPLAVAMAWLTNPVTVPPIYYFEYRVGAWMMGVEAIGSRADFWNHWVRISETHPGYWDRVLHLAGDIGYPLFLGSLPVAAILALLSYPLTLWLCQRRARKVEAGSLHPVGGELLPEPTHSLRADTTSISAADLQAHAASTPGGDGPTIRGGRHDPSNAGPGGAARSAAWWLLLLAPCAASSACAEPADRFTTEERQVEARVDGELALWCGLATPATFMVVAPSAPAAVQAGLGEERSEFALHVFHFEDAPEPFAIPPGGVTLGVEDGRGRIESVEASDLLSRTPPASRDRLASRLGRDGVRLDAATAARLAVVMPRGVDLATCARAWVVVGERRVDLALRRVAATRFEELRARPTRDGFLQWGAASADSVDGSTTPAEAPNGEREPASK